MIGRRAALGCAVAVALALGGTACSTSGTATSTSPAASGPIASGKTVACHYTDEASGFESIPSTVPASVPAGQRDAFKHYLDQVRAGAAKQRETPKPDATQPDSGTATVTLHTNRGDIVIDVDRAQAPCNAAAVLSAAQHGYYDDTACHRLAQSIELRILQCGDPTGTGIGQPRWASPDEPPRGLRAAPGADATPGLNTAQVIYPRGTVAVANRWTPNRTGAQATNSGGAAQFFIVTADTALAPRFAVIGRVDDAGMRVVDTVVAGGITPTGPAMAPEDGAPRIALTISSARVSG